MMRFVTTPSNYPPSVGKFRPEQIATRKTWTRVPDPQIILAAVHTITVKPFNGSTVTHVNPLDPASTSDGEPSGWYDRWGKRR